MKAVFRKELRDVLRWTPLTTLVACVMTWIILPDQYYGAVSVEDNLFTSLGLVACLIAIGLGLLQSLYDIRSDARGYLLHRIAEPQ